MTVLHKFLQSELVHQKCYVSSQNVILINGMRIPKLPTIMAFLLHYSEMQTQCDAMALMNTTNQFIHRFNVYLLSNLKVYRKRLTHFCVQPTLLLWLFVVGSLARRNRLIAAVVKKAHFEFCFLHARKPDEQTFIVPMSTYKRTQKQCTSPVN